MLIHSQPPHPDECVCPEDECKNCRFFQRCREIVLKKNNKGMDMKEIQRQVILNSRISLIVDEGEYTPED